jgi:hypothetical protein
MMAVMSGNANASGAERAARLLFCAGALGEIGTGLLLLVFPRLVGILINAAVDVPGLLIARVFGSTILALGVTWWIAKNEPLERLTSGYLPGFLIYNLGVGVLFVLRALAASEPAWPWLVATVHVVAGVGFAAAVLTAPRPEAAH